MVKKQRRARRLRRARKTQASASGSSVDTLATVCCELEAVSPAAARGGQGGQNLHGWDANEFPESVDTLRLALERVSQRAVAARNDLAKIYNERAALVARLRALGVTWDELAVFSGVSKQALIKASKAGMGS